ncbi:unnamed protein product [Orchesella dallaii]|uniref:HEAT repeat-containing protein 5B n=1 Tax=Orchesella dallaii TaxID=48710 RepID=A0ABP1S4I5_9HEXA
MEKAKFLLLNEQALSELPDVQKPIFILEWLRHVETVLSCISRIELKASQKQLVDQLLLQIQAGPGPPIRNLVAQCMATLFSIGDTITLFDTVNKCNDLLKPLKDDSPSIKLAALACLGCMYSRLGRMMGRSYEETVQVCSKTFRNMESQSRIETLNTFEKICGGMDTACSSSHKDMYKIAKVCLTDRVMAVRTSAAKCILQMMSSAPFLYTSELESLTSLCFRALDGADYDGRIAIAKLLGIAVSYTQRPPTPGGGKGKGIMITTSSSSGKGSSSSKPVSLEECLSILMTGFLRGATSFLKGEIIKGSSGVNREVRVGVTHAYVSFIEQMGPSWLEKNLEQFTNHVLELVANPKAATSHVDAVYSRKCVNFILRRAFGRLLSEKAQFSVVKVLAGIILKQMNSIDFNPENAKECNQETIFNQHLLVCALQELAALFLSLGTSMYHLVSDPTVALLNGIFSVLIHPCQSTRLSAAWALRCLCVAIPSETHKCIERCLQAFDSLKTSPEAVSGYSAALSAILGGVRSMPLGIPHATGKIVFNTAEELLRTASQSSRLSIQRSAAGWLMIGSIMTLGNSVVKALLPRMLLLWRNSFPKSAKELESEKARGDAFTWQVTLEGRAGALSSIHSFLLHCPMLLSEEIVQRLMVPIESALAMMTNITSTLKTYGPQLKAAAANLRFRLYQTLTLIKPNYFERSYTHMLRFVIWELTLNDNVANTTTSLFTRVCQSNAIFNSLVSDHVSIEDQLQPTGAAGSGAIEHDPCSLYQELAEGSSVPLPFPLGVAVIDSAIELFGILYPHISTKHRTQLIDHFVECLKVTKYARKEAVLVNIFCGVLMAMRCIRRLGNSSSTTSSNGISGSTSGGSLSTSTLNTSFTLSGGDIAGQSTSLKSGNGVEELKLISQQLVASSLGHTSGVIRCAAAEVMGRIAQSVADPRFTSETASFCADKLKISRDVSNRTGHSLALGCLHKYLGGMDSSRHQHGSVSILLNVAQDSSSPETQVWALHSLALVADTGGPLFRSYVEPSLSLVMKLVSTAPLSSVDLRQAGGKMLSALITGVGPELQMAGGNKEMDAMKKSFEIGCALLSRPEEHPLVQNEAITCFQRMHLFGGTINYDVVIPVLFRSMSSTNLLLRRSTVDCFRQLSQREAALVSKYFTKQVQSAPEEKQEEYAYYLESGISGALFEMLDLESDQVIRKGIRDTVTSIFSAAATQDKVQLQVCISLCKNILTCDSSASAVGASGGGGGGGSGLLDSGTPPDDSQDFGDDDADALKLNDELNSAGSNRAQNSRWRSRTFAAECVRKLLITSPFILNSQSADTTGQDLLRHLSDLIRMAFMGATSNSDSLRLEGLLNLETIIEKFASIRDPDFPSASILEQFQAQVSAALRPAFAVETDPMVTATACRVCSAWICGNSQGGEDLRRVHTLMVSALENIRTKPTLPDFNESANTLEKLAILKAWAQVFVTAVENGLKDAQGGLNEVLKQTKTKDPLLRLVKPELDLLCPLWLSALRDRALIELPPEFAPQLPREGGAFFSNETKDVVRPYYRDGWPPILLASAICLSTLPELASSSSSGAQNHQQLERFYLVFGLGMEALCKQPFSELEGGDTETATMFLKSLWALLSSHWPRDVISQEKALTIELCCVLHRQLVTRCDIRIQQLVIDVLRLVIEGMRENFNKIAEEENEKDESGSGSEKNIENDNETGLSGAEEELSSQSGALITPAGNKSVVMSVLEVVFCLLMQKIPTLNSHVSGFQVKPTGTAQENDKLLGETVACLELLPDICSDSVAIGIQPTVLYLTSCILGEPVAQSEACGKVLRCYKKFVAHRLISNPSWERYLLSTLIKVLDMAKTSDSHESSGERQAYLLGAIAIFIKDAPPPSVRIPNVLYPSINTFQQAYQSGNEQVRLKAIGLIAQVFEKADRSVSTCFIHALAPRILQYLYGEEAKNVGSKVELEFILESLRAIQILVQLVDSSSKRVQMLTLIVPVLINFLVEPHLLGHPMTAHRKLLHDVSLQKLMKIGLQYREEFRALMSQCADMRIKLETVIKNSKSLSGNNSDEKTSAGNSNSNSSSGSIKLKTDFSNFTS